MKFDFIIGNPPYQEESAGDNNSNTALYNYFFDSAVRLSDKVELITPAKFLFDAGYTPSEWNKKMLSDPHLRVLTYEQKSSIYFPGTNISGGVAILYRDANVFYGAIGAFSPFELLNSVNQKVWEKNDKNMSDIVSNRGIFKYSQLAYQEYAKLDKLTADRRIAPSCFERIPELFSEDKPNDEHNYIRVFGNYNSERIYRWFRRDYLAPVDCLDKYKILFSKADGAAGQIGCPIPARICGRPIIVEPGVASTETFLVIGPADTLEEAEAIEKYIRTKFARAMLGIMKVTQNITKPTWSKVPIQDFTKNSDINWSQTISNIDKQLYHKYGLNEKEIDFIETHVKEME